MSPVRTLEQRGKACAEHGLDESVCGYQPGTWQREAWLKGYHAEKSKQTTKRSGKKPSRVMQDCLTQINRMLST